MTPALCSELRLCRVGCPGRLRGRKGRAAQGLPGWDPSTWRPPALSQGAEQGAGARFPPSREHRS